MKTFVSDISRKEFPEAERVSGHSIRMPLLELIRKNFPDFDHDKCISLTELNYYREKYISDFLLSEIRELTELEKNVVSSLKDQETISSRLEGEDRVPLTTGQRIADKVAMFGGSWKFIISFGVFLLAWICLNVFWFSNAGFDPFPFILLNLILSCIAALQAPVIMMSQNRQEEKDRERAKKDFMINLKSELEIRMLHEKIDHLIMHQQQQLIEIQKQQVEMMHDILNQLKPKP
ncbi:MAG: Uncharacterized protein FD123_2977 [Bacteroidetes bacterium]|nr:MAG: Uncharacterized protein FD123_2977 [Bacteroidota bacterium]